MCGPVTRRRGAAGDGRRVRGSVRRLCGARRLRRAGRAARGHRRPGGVPARRGGRAARPGSDDDPAAAGATARPAAAAAASAGVAVWALTRADTRPLAVTAAVAAVVAIGALVAGATAGRWEASPRQRRLADMLETLLLVSVAPLVLGAWDVYSKIFHL